MRDSITTRSALLLLAAIAAAVACAAPGAFAKGGAGGGGGGGASTGRTISVLPDTSALELSGYPGSTELQVDVLRDGVPMATASITTDSAGDGDVNGGGLSCWSDATPDILPGDTVRVTGSGFVDEKVVDDISSSRPMKADSDTIVVHGTAVAADGTPLPLAGIEARIIGSAADRFSNGRRDMRAGGTNTFPLTQDAGDPTHWTATFSGLTPDDVAKALDAIEMRGIFTDTADPNQTISQNPGARGPMPPCTTPMRRDAITDASRTTINAQNSGDDLVLSGVAQDASDVTVTLDDGDRMTRAITVPATLSTPSGGQTFTATIPGADVQGLSDGTLTASATYTVGGTDIAGRGLTLLKDTIAPPAPTATPGTGTYASWQSVAIEDEDATAALHWTAGATAPTADSATFRTPILVTSTQTIRAIAVDRAGNESPVSAFAFTILPPAAPAATAPAAPVPAATAPTSAVAGETAQSVLRVHSLSLPARIRAARLRSRGVRVSVRVPADAVVVRVALHRANRAGARTGQALATVVRATPGRSAVMRISLRTRALLHPGRYVVEVAAGRSRATLGIPSTRRLTVTR